MKLLKKTTTKLILLAIFILSLVIFFLSRASADVTTFSQDGTIEEYKTTNPADPESIEPAKKVHQSTCVDPKAIDLIETPDAWTVQEDAINDGVTDYNYVVFLSPDHQTRVADGREYFTGGGEILLIVTCNPRFKNIHEIIEFETTYRIFLTSDQEPTYLNIDGQQAAQYYFGDVGDPPLMTIWFKDGKKYTLQYNFAITGENTASLENPTSSSKDYKELYTELLETIQLP